MDLYGICCFNFSLPLTASSDVARAVENAKISQVENRAYSRGALAFRPIITTRQVIRAAPPAGRGIRDGEHEEGERGLRSPVPLMNLAIPVPTCYRPITVAPPPIATTAAQPSVTNTMPSVSVSSEPLTTDDHVRCACTIFTDTRHLVIFSMRCGVRPPTASQ